MAGISQLIGNIVFQKFSGVLFLQTAHHQINITYNTYHYYNGFIYAFEQFFIDTKYILHVSNEGVKRYNFVQNALIIFLLHIVFET